MERDTPYVLETVYLVIDERYESGKPFVITTNLSLEELRNRQTWSAGASMTASWRDVFLLLFLEKIIGKTKAGRTWRILRAF